MESEIIVVTGASGFLGQHLIEQLTKIDSQVREIRTIDLRPFTQPSFAVDDVQGSNSKGKILKHFIGDLSKTESLSLDDIFTGVSTVFHCAALVSYSSFWVSDKEFEDNNVLTTKNIIKICSDFNVLRLIFTSTTEVAMRSYYLNKKGFFSLIINQTEDSKTLQVNSNHALIIDRYAETKLEAEKLVLSANGTKLASGFTLKTIALRPTFLYGPGDKFLIPKILEWTQNYFAGYFPQISYLPGLLQLTYVENASWAHIIAKNALKSDNENISGLAVIITDSTPTEDLLKFCDQFIERKPLTFLPFIPFFLSYFLAIVWLFFWKFFVECGWTKGPDRYQCCPRILTAILASAAHFNSLRAKIHMKYTPLVSHQDAINKSKLYYKNLFVK